MSEKVEDKDVNTDSIDNVTDDHDAGIGSSADEMETHNLDIDDYDEVIENAQAHEEDDSSGGTENTDDSTDDTDGKSGKEEEARIPKSRLDEVIGQRDEKDAEIIRLKEEMARERGMFEGRLQALEAGTKTQEEEIQTTSPFDEMLSGEPQEILDALQENPAEFFQNLKSAAETKAKADIAAAQEEQDYYDNLRSGLDAFAADHEGFMENVERMGGIVDTNPIHNLVSAFAYEVEIPALKAAHEEALAKATGDLEAAKAEGVKIGKAEALKEFRAKGGAAVLDGSQSTQGAKLSSDPELDDTEKSGGIRAILTDKLLKRRATS